jgi:lysine 2,3-aminomutase
MERVLTSAEALVDAGLLPASRLAEANAVASRYAVAVTPDMARLIETSDDAIGLQFLPQARELVTLPEENPDPIGDHAHSPVEGIVHRYPDRVLLKVLHVCPVYCRFCFRREMVGPAGDGTLSGDKLQAALDYISGNPQIWEVILTGGDPLMLSPRRMAGLMRAFAAMPHVRVVRLHSRVPVVSPERMTDEMLEALTCAGKTVYLAVHANHAREFTQAARDAINRIANRGIVLLSQTVLLKGINSDPDVLADLMRTFVENRIRPYYLHHPDLAPGTSHFRLTIPEGRKIVDALRGRVSGLCQPTYILDIPGGFGKTPLSAETVRELPDGRFELTDFRGETHLYPVSGQEPGRRV